MDCLVVTHPSDVPARIYEVLFRIRGKSLYRWFISDLPGYSEHSFKFRQEPSLEIHDKYRTVDILNPMPKIVWTWRNAPPKFDGLSIHPDDAGFAKATVNAYNRSVYHFLDRYFSDQKIPQINGFGASQRAESKCLQLYCAGKVGLETPLTLISNSYDSFNEFANQFETVCKDFVPYAWKRPGGKRLANFTSDINATDVAAGDAFRACMTIFQEKIHKAYEIRLIIFDKYYYGSTIDAQSRDELKRDWRYAPLN